MTLRYALFPTALGVAGIAWRDGAIARAKLPEADPEAVRARLLRGTEGAVEAEPEGVGAEAVRGVRALFAGERVDLAATPLDWTGVDALARGVYRAALAIPHGETRTYGEIARGLGDVRLSQAVGQALGRNPFAPIVPCHRVLASGGRTGGFSAGEGARFKLAILNIERARTAAEPMLFDELPLAAR